MEYLDKAIKSVRENGNHLDLLRLRCALHEPYTPAEAEKILSLYQFLDGSWDYSTAEEEPDRIGSLGGTIHCLRWLREFRLGNTAQMTRTLKFLTTIQDSDGSFYETKAKLAHSPHKWLQEETIIDRFYFTAAVVMRLFSLGYREHALVNPTLQWLSHYWEDWDLVTGTWYNLWALLCLYPFESGFPPSLYTRCYEKAVDWLSHLDAQPLTWLLDALQGAGFSKDEQLIVQGMSRLKTLQDEEGVWADSKYSAVETTVTAVRLLKDYHTSNW